MLDLQNAAIIREVHIYGQSLEVGDQQEGAAQHSGLGKALINFGADRLLLLGRVLCVWIAECDRGCAQHDKTRGDQQAGDREIVRSSGHRGQFTPVR